MNATKKLAQGSDEISSKFPQPFETEEQRQCNQENGYAPYWNSQNKLCRAVLEAGRYPQDFELIRALFPVVRTAVSFGFPITESNVPYFWELCFGAGSQFARSCPTAAQTALGKIEREKVEELLGLMDRFFREQPAGEESLVQTFRSIWNLKPMESSKEEIWEWVISVTIRAFAAGMAAELWREDLQGVLFVKELYLDLTNQGTSPHIRAITASAASDYGKTLRERLEHPLLKTAAEHYSRTPQERAALLPFFHAELKKSVTSEVNCPGDDLDLVGWVESGLAFGRRLRGDVNLVREIEADLGPTQLAYCVRLCRSVQSGAQSETPLELTRSIMKWYVERYAQTNIQFYGPRLDRVVRFADMAIWIGLLEDLSDTAAREVSRSV